MSKEEIFVALSGPNFNGTDFFKEAIKKGASQIIYSQKDISKEHLLLLESPSQNYKFTEVENTYDYLKIEARKHLQKWKYLGGKVIAITGSNGKTTTKEMLAFLVSHIIGNELFYTKNNLNNKIGVPLNVFNLSSRHRLAIFEIGMNKQGEIQELCDIIAPDGGVITNIGDAHIEHLRNKSGVFEEKKSLYNSVMKNSNQKGIFIINTDDIYLKNTS